MSSAVSLGFCLYWCRSRKSITIFWISKFNNRKEWKITLLRHYPFKDKTQIRQTLQRSPCTLPHQRHLHRPIRRFRTSFTHRQNHTPQRPRNMERLRQLRSPIGTHTHHKRNHRPAASYRSQYPKRHTYHRTQARHFRSPPPLPTRSLRPHHPIRQPPL